MLTAAARERIRIQTPLLLGSAAGWLLVVWSTAGMVMAPFSRMHAMPASGSFKLSAPGSEIRHLAFMLIAMMLPLLGSPLRHVHARTLARRRRRSISLFLAGYFTVWMMTGMALVGLSLAARLLFGTLAFPALIAASVVWQCSPAKQRSLNRCHYLPHVAAFGRQADRGVIGFGLSHGLSCAGSCWLLMLIPMVVAQFHLAAMILTGFWMAGERLERPSPACWAWRAPIKAVRILLRRSFRPVPHPTEATWSAT